MTKEDLLIAWAQIEAAAKEQGVSPAEVREDIKASIAKLWAEEESGSNEWPARVQTLHSYFSSLPSVEVLLTLRRKLADAMLGMDHDQELDFF